MKSETKNYYQLPGDFLTIPALIICGLVLPFVLIPIIGYVGYSEAIEEISKALVIVFIILRIPKLNYKIMAGVLFGFLFSLSESFLYLNNIFQINNFDVLWQRFFLTGPMHIITVLVIILSGLKSKRYIVLGLFGAIIIHLLFNYFVA